MEEVQPFQSLCITLIVLVLSYLPPSALWWRMLEINVTENFCEKVILHLQDNGTLDTCFMNDKQNILRISCLLTVTGNQSPSALASAFQV